MTNRNGEPSVTDIDHSLLVPPSKWHALPPELLLLIFGSLEASDLLRAELCCRAWYQFLSTSQVGHKYFRLQAATPVLQKFGSFQIQAAPALQMHAFVPSLRGRPRLIFASKVQVAGLWGDVEIRLDALSQIMLQHRRLGDQSHCNFSPESLLPTCRSCIACLHSLPESWTANIKQKGVVLAQ